MTGLCESKKDEANTMENNTKIKTDDLSIFKYE